MFWLCLYSIRGIVLASTVYYTQTIEEFVRC